MGEQLEVVDSERSELVHDVDEASNDDSFSTCPLKDPPKSAEQSEDEKDLPATPNRHKSLRESSQRKTTRRARVVDGSTDTSSHLSKQMEDMIKVADQKDKDREYTRLEEFLAPQKSGLFRQAKVDPKALYWTKASLKRPLSEIDKELSRMATDCFTNIQKFMGDRLSARFFGKPVARNEALGLLQDIITKAINHDELKNEIYLQIYKQLNKNPKSEVLGWEILSVFSSIIAPSKGLFPFLITFMDESLDRIPETTTDEEEKKLLAIIAFTKRKLTRLIKLPPRRQALKLREIEHIATISPYRNNVFGETLEDIMKAPENRDESGLYPRVLRFLAEGVILLKGCETQGIFRVPGDVDQVIDLRLQIEQGSYELANIDDPAVPASLLKQWIRELVDPVIPTEFYDRCLKVGNDVDKAMCIVDELPEYNRNVLKYIAKYLQVVGDPKYQPQTKMTISNLSMVFAPNLLRCPSDNPLVILTNQKPEQNFLKILVNYLEE